ncbi:MAG: ATP synthase F1 subunit epsilon [Chitinophagales bacterium]|jgi:F-type H+-transporting ATPase subunit epsilon
MNLTILSPDKEIFTGSVKSVQAPGLDGSFQLLENHAPIVSALGKGAVTVVTDSGEKLRFAVEGGFLEMLNNEVSLLVSGVSE